MKRGQSGIDALLAIDKPVGMTSHDVVSRVRRALGERRVGHAGTLDPAASGVLVVGVGQGTRLMGLLTAERKGYVDISSVARAMGGGGHKAAAGFTVEGGIDAALAKALPQLQAVLDAPEDPSSEAVG